jgi:hypothetical protein
LSFSITGDGLLDVVLYALAILGVVGAAIIAEMRES